MITRTNSNFPSYHSYSSTPTAPPAATATAFSAGARTLTEGACSETPAANDIQSEFAGDFDHDKSRTAAAASTNATENSGVHATSATTDSNAAGRSHAIDAEECFGREHSIEFAPSHAVHAIATSRASDTNDNQTSSAAANATDRTTAATDIDQCVDRSQAAWPADASLATAGRCACEQNARAASAATFGVRQLFFDSSYWRQGLVTIAFSSRHRPTASHQNYPIDWHGASAIAIGARQSSDACADECRTASAYAAHAPIAEYRSIEIEHRWSSVEHAIAWPTIAAHLRAALAANATIRHGKGHAIASTSIDDIATAAHCHCAASDSDAATIAWPSVRQTAIGATAATANYDRSGRKSTAKATASQ